ncbi:ExbD/TolR family protein [Saccharophagus degradans]|uniref:Biopolymer transporter ExbD n=1 Tax=Saccharophagus degradans TaxID=86304 RepID=A0AAW7X9Q9_9GAMM|nr:biopolymer transporter ExbD [Saccharophagus degradans]MDO6423631.1 biopolymer transporter ExbD [Saccharophagus degradans]MDO6607697.1 biopolymer transporter ExbD [Saccharophagus degradans]
MKQSIHAKRMARHHKRNSVPKLNLVSLMDIFTILVFFLLVNSSEVEVLQSNKDIDLPQSIAEKKPDNNLIIMISQDNIIVGGRSIVSVENAVAEEGLNITALADELARRAKNKPYKSEEEAAKGRSVTIMGDKGIPYTMIKKVMSTCANSDFRNISLAVNQVPDASAEGLLESAGGEG